MTKSFHATPTHLTLAVSAVARGPLRVGGGIGLAGCFASLLGGCFTSSCPDGGTGETFIDTRDVEVSASQLSMATLGDGSLDCGALCGEDHDFTGCEDLGPVATGAGGAGAAGSGAAGSGAAGSGAAGGSGGVGGFGAVGGSGGAGGGAVGGTGGSEVEPDHRIRCSFTATAVCEGRRHAAVRADVSGRGPNELAAWLSAAAQAEAASVQSFVALMAELEALGAPRELVDAARASAADEVRHARQMGALAERWGAAPATGAEKAAPIRRSLFALALENAVEGCVFETYAALQAMHQARAAHHAALRDTFDAIAADEIEHGELAWAIHRWACARLSPGEVLELHAAMRGAAARLVDDLAVSALSDDALAALGLPDATKAVELAGAVRDRLWS